MVMCPPMATLKQYLEEENISQAQFAALLNESLQNVNRWVNGRLPARETVCLIDSMTNGKVTFADWYREHGASSH
jgi:transcriptional regulator with XRE-family HTH domain